MESEFDCWSWILFTKAQICRSKTKLRVWALYGLRNEAPEFVPGFNRRFWFKIYIKRWKKFVLEPICSAVRVTSINWNYSRKLLHVCIQKYQTFQIIYFSSWTLLCNVRCSQCKHFELFIINLWATGSNYCCGMDHEVHVRLYGVLTDLLL